jgi:hypothetical protein
MKWKSPPRPRERMINEQQFKHFDELRKKRRNPRIPRHGRERNVFNAHTCCTAASLPPAAANSTSPNFAEALNGKGPLAASALSPSTASASVSASLAPPRLTTNEVRLREPGGSGGAGGGAGGSGGDGGGAAGSGGGDGLGGA